MNYWFVRVKVWNEDKDESWLSDVINESEEVFKSEDRESAKKYCINKYGKFPFRKPKEIKNGDKYFYLTDSDEYWFNYHNKEIEIDCPNCGTKKTVYGVKNHYQGFCNYDCYKSFKNNNRTVDEIWIDKDDHIDEKDGIPYGYIYKITNKKSMMSYVGQTVNVPIFRWWQHLKESNDKFGQESISDLVFEVIDIVYRPKYDVNVTQSYRKCDDELFNDRYIIQRDEEVQLKNELDYREAKWIEYYDCVNSGYNKKQPTTEQQQQLLLD